MLKHLAGVALFGAGALWVGLRKPFSPGLPAAGHLALMGLLFAVGLWIFAARWVPMAVGGAIMLLLFVAAGIKMTSVFSGFTNRAVWILIPALFFGFALSKVGLGKRLAYYIIGLFRPSYLTLTFSWVIIGVVLSALTPSAFVRIAIVTPVAVATTDICRLRHGSPGASYILLVAWAMALLPGTGWLNGGLWGPMGLGFFEATPGLETIITFQTWSQALFLPIEIISALFIVVLYLVMRPAEPINIPAGAFREEYKALGPMTFREKTTLAILLLAFALFATGQLHGIPDVAICLGAFALLAVFGIIRTEDIGPGISWNLIIYMGSILGLIAVFGETGVSTFLGSAFAPVVSRLAVNPWLFVYAVVLALFLWRFLDIAQLLPTIPFILPLFPLLAQDFGISPLVSYTLVILAGNCFFLSYQQPFVIAAEAIAGRARWAPEQLTRAGVVYFIVCLIALAIAIPYWTAVGLIK